ncbi:Serine protease HTRA3 [Bienertia sinuspersici]
MGSTIWWRKFTIHRCGRSCCLCQWTHGHFGTA